MMQLFGGREFGWGFCIDLTFAHATTIIKSYVYFSSLLLPYIAVFTSTFLALSESKST